MSNKPNSEHSNHTCTTESQDTPSLKKIKSGNITLEDLNDREILQYLITTREGESENSHELCMRDYFTTLDVASVSTKIMESLFFALEIERQRLALTAKIVCDKFWCLNLSCRRDYHTHELGYPRTTVRVRGRAVEMLWQRTYFPPRKDNQKSKPIGSHLRKGRGTDYDTNQLMSLCRMDWEREMVMNTEEQYRAIRKDLQTIKQIQSLLVQYIRRKADHAQIETNVSWGQIPKRKNPSKS